MEDTELLAAVVTAIAEKKGLEPLVLEVGKITPIADYFVICHGANRIHVQAIVEGIMEKLKEGGVVPLRREGMEDAHWVLLDYGGVVVHIFQERDREFYALERLWGDAPQVKVGK